MSNYNVDFKSGAVNPYTFVSLGKGVERGTPISGDISGVIHCSLTNATSIALPDMPLHTTEIIQGEKKAEEHKTAPFFKINGKPVIPGSELRGVIRSAYETLSDSCFSVNNNNILSARSSEVRNPGVIRFENKDNKWHLYKADAKKLKYDGSEDFDETPDSIKRTWKNYKYIKKGNKSIADYKGRKIPVSYKFTTNFEEIPVNNLDLAVEDYMTVCKIYCTNDSSLKEYISKLTPKKDGKCCPVYYLEFADDSEKYVWLSPAQVSRSVFRKRVDDLLGTYRHCDDTQNVCEACGLFGMIGKKGCEPSAIASRLRFTDATLQNDGKLSYKTLKELASPRLSSIEFYSTAPNMKHQWNYDTRGVKLNGRKYYFHHTGDCTTSKKTGRNLTTELLENGAKFSFDIYFDQLTEKELNRLIWTLAIGENDVNGHQMHKIGHGKPLGLGSIKIIVDSVEKRNFDPEKMCFADEQMNVSEFFTQVPFDDNAEYFKEYMAVTDFNYLENKPVAYPYGDDKKGSETSVGALTWFKANHNDGKMVVGEPCAISYHLPKITDKNKLILPALIASDSHEKSTSFGSKTKNKTEYTGPTSFGEEKANGDTERFMCKKCKTWNEVKKNKPFPKPNSLIICKNCKTKFYEKF